MEELKVDESKATGSGAAQKSSEVKVEKTKAAKAKVEKGKLGKEGKDGSKEKGSEVKPGSVLKMDEIGSIIDLGLGRGVNATHTSPWFQKSSFQVRAVTPDNVIGTEEGGILQSYAREVVSVEEIQTQMSTSVPVSSQVSVGIDEELSRSYSTSRRSLGKKIITRSVTFKPDIADHLTFEDSAVSFPQTPVQQDQEKDAVKSKFFTEKHSLPTTQAPSSFERTLSHWIIESLLDEETAGVKEPNPTDDPNHVLAKVIFNWPGGVADMRCMLKRKCSEFISKYSITHYVSGIDMGAAQYEVISEEQYVKQFGVKNSLEILKVVDQVVSFKSKSSIKSRSSQLTEIGRFDGNSVKRGTTDEAVVGVTFQPISALVSVPVLRSALQAAIKHYIEDQQFSRAGPFIISCNNERIYLKVTEDLEVVATTNIQESSDFYISYNEDGQSAYEFSITYMAPSSLAERDVKSIPSYLYAPVNIRGKNRGPLNVRLDAADIHTKFTLRSRRINQFNPVDTKDWLSSRDIFYINCKNKAFTRSFICVKRRGRSEEYITSCVNTINKHLERDHFMLFRLLRAAKRNPPEPRAEETTENQPLGIRESSLFESKDTDLLAGSREEERGLEMTVKGKGVAAELQDELEAKL